MSSRGDMPDYRHSFVQIETSDNERPESRRPLAFGLALLGSSLLLGSLALAQRSPAPRAKGDPRELTLFDPCFIKGPCTEGVVWFPGIEFLGPGWYCKDRLHVKKTDVFDECHIVAPCFYGAVWSGKRWECAVEDKKKVVKKYEKLMEKLMKGPHRGDKIWAIRELDHELPKLATSCPERGYQAPKKCRMIGMDHGHLMLSTNCAVLFDLVVCEDPEMRGRASGVLYNIVTDHKENLKLLIDKMGGLELLIKNLNPETNTTAKSRGKALFGLNMMASECKAQSPEMCNFFQPLSSMNSAGLAHLVWNPLNGSGEQLQVALQEAWVASCTVKQGLPSSSDFQACGGRFLSNLTNGTKDQVYATLQSLHSLLNQDLWRQKYSKELTEVKPVYHKLPAEAKLVAHKLLV